MGHEYSRMHVVIRVAVSVSLVQRMRKFPYSMFRAKVLHRWHAWWKTMIVLPYFFPV